MPPATSGKAEDDDAVESFYWANREQWDKGGIGLDDEIRAGSLKASLKLSMYC